MPFYIRVTDDSQQKNGIFFKKYSRLNILWAGKGVGNAAALLDFHHRSTYYSEAAAK